MKFKTIIIIVFLFLIIFGIQNYNKKEENNLTIKKEDLEANITEYYIYGNHLNIIGNINITEYDDIKLIMLNKEEQEINIITTKEEDKTTFKISDEINNGLYLDDINKGNNYLFLKIITSDEIKYYGLNNDTEYESTKYYTLSKYNNIINIKEDNDYNTLSLIVNENKDKEIYDITIDAGHGGKDSGAIGHGYYEKNIALDVALLLKEELQKNNLKVAITRNEDVTLEEYNLNNNIGRAVIAHNNNSKYLFSIHLNSHSKKTMKGVEILTPHNIDYTFAKNLADNIVKETKTTYSNNQRFKMYNGVYTRIINEQEIMSRNKSSDNPYNIKVGASYYYMLREPGGYVTGAYVDGREEKVGINPYYNSNKGVESYIIELGYIINKEDITNIVNNKDKYVKAITESILNEFNEK